MLRIHALRTGDVRIDSALAHRTKVPFHPLPASGWFRGPRHKYWAPVPAHLIETDDALVLVDTGWHERIRTDPVAALNRLALTMYQGRQEPGQELPARLEALGYRLRDLTHVVMTHLHSDHASGLAYLKGLDVPVVLGPGEWREANRNPAYVKHQFRLPLAYRDAEYHTLRGVPGFDAAHDLLGDGRILLLPTPGHTRGHQSLLVRGERDVLLTADSAYDRDALARGILPGSLSAPKAAARSLAAVRRFVDDEPDAIVQFGHDPATFDATRRALRTLGRSREHARAA